MKKVTLNVILYCRVSTDEQGVGYSPEYQKQSLMRYCEVHNLNMVEIYFDDSSGKTFNRPEWQKLETYIKANRKFVDKVLFVKWDRFSRSVSLAHQKIDLFNSKYGVELCATEQPLDLAIPESLLMLSNYLALSEIERRRISMRTSEGIYQAKKEGYYTHMAPYGYDNIKIGKKIGRKQRTSLSPNDKARFVRMAFEEVAKGLEPSEVIRRKLIEKGFKMSKSNFPVMLMKETYMGKILVPEYKGEASFLVDGKHEPIVDEVLFYKVQEVLLGNGMIKNLPKKLNEKFPLRSFLTCAVCGKAITASTSKGRNGKYHYYHCKNRCEVRLRDIEVENRFDKILSNIEISDSVRVLYEQILLDTIRLQEGDKEEKLRVISSKKASLNEMIINIENQLSCLSITPETFNNINSRLQKDLRAVNYEIEALNSKKDTLEDSISGAMTVLFDIKKIYENADIKEKQILLGSIFKENLVLSKTDCRTTKLNEVVALLNRNSNGFGEIKKRKAVKNDSLSCVVQWVGRLSNFLCASLQRYEKLNPLIIKSDFWG